MIWDPEIPKLYNKFSDRTTQYSPSTKEWKLLSSAEYGFYEAYRAFPPTRQDAAIKMRLVNGWFRNTLGGDWNTRVEDWICELTQNAFDRDATECYIGIDKDNRILNFGHNGSGIRGPTKDGPGWGDVRALIEMGISLKNYDLHSEGRFGVGFKYWMKHFSQVILTANNLKMGWTKAFQQIEPSRKEMKERKNWTLFQFSGAGEEGNVQPLELQMSELQRLKDAIRMRTDKFKLTINIGGGGNSESCCWEHKITSNNEFEDLQILSCLDHHEQGGDIIT